MDIRIEKTERAIRNAFWEMRSQKPLEKITVKELCSLAYINKSTFYAHYQDIYALSNKLEEETISSILESVLPNQEYSIQNAEVFTHNLCMAFFSHISLIRVLFSGGERNNLTDRIEKGIKEMIYRKYPDFAGDLRKNIMISFCIQGAYHALLNHGDQNFDTALEVVEDMVKSVSYRLTG
jgi:AcrR family transcriptional regulator